MAGAGVPMVGRIKTINMHRIIDSGLPISSAEVPPTPMAALVTRRNRRWKHACYFVLDSVALPLWKRPVGAYIGLRITPAKIAAQIDNGSRQEILSRSWPIKFDSVGTHRQMVAAGPRMVRLVRGMDIR